MRTLADDPSVGTAGTLVLGADVTVEQTSGANGFISNGSSTNAAATIINDGTIIAEDATSGATLNIELTGNHTLSFTNNGGITVSTTGDTVDVAAAETGTGSYTIDAGTTLEFSSSVVPAQRSIRGLDRHALADQPSSSSTRTVIAGLTGTPSGTGDILDCKGFSSRVPIRSSHHRGRQLQRTDTTLTVTDRDA